jgi:hypothetical protein
MWINSTRIVLAWRLLPLEFARYVTACAGVRADWFAHGQQQAGLIYDDPVVGMAARALGAVDASGRVSSPDRAVGLVSSWSRPAAGGRRYADPAYVPVCQED